MTDKTPKGKRESKPKGRPALRIVTATQGEVVHLAKGQGRNAHGLTSKQEAFCHGVGARGETLAVAYRAAYDAANMAPHTVHNEACKLMARPDIAARVNSLVQARQAQSQHDAVRIRQHVLERLHIESVDLTSPPAARIRATELLAKLSFVGMFTQQAAQDDVAAPAADLAATLEARLRAMLAKAG